jgi:hypothetical protein
MKGIFAPAWMGSGTLIVKEMLLPASGKSRWESYAGSGAASKKVLGGTLQVDRRQRAITENNI